MRSYTTRSSRDRIAAHRSQIFNMSFDEILDLIITADVFFFFVLASVSQERTGLA